MANDNHLSSVTLYNVTTMNIYYNEFFEKGQQKIYFDLYQIGLPSDDPVYTHYYRCHDGRRLDHIRTEVSPQDGYARTMEVYGCEDCGGCEHKARFLYRYDEVRDANKNKIMKVNEAWEDLKSEFHENIQSKQGILNRQIRSIQTEGHFGDIKENDNFRRFNTRSSEKVYKEFMLYAMARNLNKYHRFKHGKIEKYEGKSDQQVA